MTDYFVAMDGFGEIALWTGRDTSTPTCVLRYSDVPDPFWPDVVARMTGTTITTDDATVERIAATMYPELMNHDENDDPAEWATAAGPHRDQWLEAARAILAALTGMPVEPVDTHRHYFVDVSTFAAADAGRHNWLCECGATDETRDRA